MSNVAVQCLQLVPVGMAVDVSDVQHRCIFIQSLIRAFFLLLKMGQSVPVLPGRLPLGMQIDRGENRYVSLLSLHDARCSADCAWQLMNATSPS